jgi:hypothetical protein
MKKKKISAMNKSTNNPEQATPSTNAEDETADLQALTSDPSSADPSPLPSESAYEKIGDPVLLDKIDKLFACNVGEHIDLPQLVVVGDQSSGKSSVLEGLTRLPFPRDSGLCTRFATQITFRKTDHKSVKVSILPDPNSSTEYQERIRDWQFAEIEQLNAEAFKKIMDQVS